MSEHAPADIRRVSKVINKVGATWMVHPETVAFGQEHGYANGFVFYAVGRGGVLGDVDPDVVASAFGFFGPSLIRTMWGIGTADHGARESAALYAQACARFGRTHFGGVEGLDRLADLGEQVIEAADPTGLTLFAGWRAEPLADDPAGRAAQVIHVLREHRGSAHLVAVLATGLKPLEAMVADQGTDRLKQFGWAEPFPDAETIRAEREAAEVLTDRLVAPAFAVLSAEEFAEFERLVTAAAAALA
jgi:hypothetical protein